MIQELDQKIVRSKKEIFSILVRLYEETGLKVTEIKIFHDEEFGVEDFYGECKTQYKIER
jgi:nucleoside diphosphate kinase